ncbi:MAG: tyrosine-type recombinase/integrase [Candidatus Eremiobacteraeota bacterium]|nr:tyrosine-type recombinase/integrase [Candidatus Eremiobacteraeota bacterium]
MEEARPQLTSPLSLNALWLTEAGECASVAWGSDFYKEYRAHKTLDFPFTLHQMRHACATHLLQAGASIREIQQLLGHRELASTEIYTHLTPTRLR